MLPFCFHFILIIFILGDCSLASWVSAWRLRGPAGDWHPVAVAKTEEQENEEQKEQKEPQALIIEIENTKNAGSESLQKVVKREEQGREEHKEE